MYIPFFSVARTLSFNSYFVSEAPKFNAKVIYPLFIQWRSLNKKGIDYLSIRITFFFLWFFSNLQSSLVLTLYSFPDCFPVSGFFWIFIKSSDFFTEWIASFSHVIKQFSFPEIYPVSGFFLDFSGFSLNLKMYILFLSLLAHEVGL